jgi:hypothetical protein
MGFQIRRYISSPVGQADRGFMYILLVSCEINASVILLHFNRPKNYDIKTVCDNIEE